jgi:hypothetical protein
MSNLQPHALAGGAGQGLSRRTSRGLADLQSAGVLQLATIEQQALVQTAKTDAVAYVGRSAMMHVAMLSQAEQELSQLVPLAATRLQGIADTVTLALAKVVVDTATRMRAL